MSFKNIREAQKTVWPAVCESLDIVKAQRDAVKADPRGATPAAKKRAGRPWTRVVADETVFAIAKADLLISPEQAAVLEAAIQWYASWDGREPSDEDEQEDADLHLAVQELLRAQ